ncbi:hypothetical protein HYZ99_05465 [Candidatus Peregrinibacteria bacterium]|nr:hypothetical protein [Candidatus Peregrinibacteria bacterium]
MTKPEHINGMELPLDDTPSKPLAPLPPNHILNVRRRIALNASPQE